MNGLRHKRCWPQSLTNKYTSLKFIETQEVEAEEVWTSLREQATDNLPRSLGTLQGLDTLPSFPVDLEQGVNVKFRGRLRD